MKLVPFLQIADPHPSARRGPDVRITTGHQERHVPSTAYPSQVNSSLINRVMLAAPLDRLQDLDLGLMRTAGKRLSIRAMKVWLYHKPFSLGRRRLQLRISLLPISTPCVETDQQWEGLCHLKTGRFGHRNRLKHCPCLGGNPESDAF